MENKTYVYARVSSKSEKFDFTKMLSDNLEFLLNQFETQFIKSNYFSDIKTIILSKLKEARDLKHHENKMLCILLHDIGEAIQFIESRLALEGEKLVLFVPFNGFEFLKFFVTNVDEYIFLSEKMKSFMSRGLIRDYEKKCIIKQFSDLEDGENNKVVYQVLEKYIDEENVDNLADLMYDIKLSKSNIDLFIKGIVLLFTNSKREEVEKVLSSQSCLDGSWSRSIGSDSPQIVEKIELFKELHNQFPRGYLRVQTKLHIDALEKQLKNDMIRYEEFLNPR
ncbi:MAG: hypothetical protein JEZ08_13330 [Clostridiales bacterium]|nr:hypothetical protein [Clostridiales bacterium]